MSGFNLISEINLTQMDRHQNEIHRNPVVNQEQNSNIAKNETQQKLNKPTETDKPEKKSIDPKQKREEKQRKKRQKPDKKNKKTDKNHYKGKSGYFVDLEA